MENELYKPNMSFRYLVSCGVSMKSLMPGWSHKWWRAFEKSGWKEQIKIDAMKNILHTQTYIAFLDLEKGIIDVELCF